MQTGEARVTPLCSPRQRGLAVVHPPLVVLEPAALTTPSLARDEAKFLLIRKLLKQNYSWLYCHYFNYQKLQYNYWTSNTLS